MSEKVIVRFPPSPTGNLHIGTARTMLFNYLFAKQNKGKILLRIEDTDKERSKKEFEDNIIDGLKWLGITYDEGPIYQTERTEMYQKELERLTESGKAYVSKEPSKNDPNIEVSVVRLKNPGKTVTFNDVVRGEITFDTTELGDFVIAKSITEALYHFAVVVDDQDGGITHVIRGDDHISNTPRQILIQEALGYPRPVYCHIPLILGSDRSKLSKRHGATALSMYREAGYLPEGMVNYLALLGWNPGTDKEFFTMDELVEEFDLSKIQKGGAVFDEKKLRWVNKEHIKALPKEAVRKMVFDKIEESFPGKVLSEDLLDTVSERIEIFSDIDTLVGAGELDYFFNDPVLNPELIFWKKDSAPIAKAHLEAVSKLILEDGDVMAYAEANGKGSVLWPLRYALSGKEKSPDPFTLLKILGKDESLKRVAVAISAL